MLTYALDQLFVFPADLAYKAEPGVLSFRPEQFEGIQQITVVLARFYGADHEVNRALSEHLFQFLAYHHMGVGLIQIAAQMEIVEPALGRCLLPEAPLHLSLYLLDDGVGDGDEAVRSAGYPVEPVLEYPYQPLIAELRVGEGDKVIDDRDDPHPPGLQTLGDRKEVSMPG